MRDIVTSSRNMILKIYTNNKQVSYYNPFIFRVFVILILFTSIGKKNVVTAGFNFQYEYHTINLNGQGNLLHAVILSDTVKQKELAANKNSDDELSRAIDEQSKMRNEHSDDNDPDSYWQEDFSSIFDDIEFPDSAAWNRAHENIKEAMNHFRSESKGFKDEFNKAKLEMNKAIKRMQKQYREFNDDELNDLKKEIQKVIDDLKTPEKPQQHKPDTIKISPL